MPPVCHRFSIASFNSFPNRHWDWNPQCDTMWRNEFLYLFPQFIEGVGRGKEQELLHHWIVCETLLFVFFVVIMKVYPDLYPSSCLHTFRCRRTQKKIDREWIASATAWLRMHCMSGLAWSFPIRSGLLHLFHFPPLFDCVHLFFPFFCCCMLCMCKWFNRNQTWAEYVCVCLCVCACIWAPSDAEFYHKLKQNVNRKNRLCFLNFLNRIILLKVYNTDIILIQLVRRRQNWFLLYYYYFYIFGFYGHPLCEPLH